MPAVLGQAAPGGVVARLVAVPVRVLGPVVPDVAPRPDSSPCPCGGPRAGAGALVRVGLTDGGGEPVPVALLVRTAAPGRGLRPGRGIVGETGTFSESTRICWATPGVLKKIGRAHV